MYNAIHGPCPSVYGIVHTRVRNSMRAVSRRRVDGRGERVYSLVHAAYLSVYSIVHISVSGAWKG